MDGERVSIARWTLVFSKVNRPCRRITTDRAVGDITPSFDMSGATGGFNVGCQYQFGWWLIGVEGDWAATNKDGQAFNNFLGFNVAGPDRFFVSQTTERWIATARLRLGWAADKWLFFVTGGGAWSGVDVTVWDSLAPVVTAHHKKMGRSPGFSPFKILSTK
jgi:hypothetical protein